VRPTPDAQVLTAALQRGLVDKGVEKGLDALLGKRRKGDRAQEEEARTDPEPEDAGEALRRGLGEILGR
jgi:hypothetical protein